MAECSGCRADIDWVVTTDGSSMPLDPAPVPDGNVVFTGRRVEKFGRLHPEVRVKPAGEQALLPDPNEQLYMSHFATCPDADNFRKDR